MKVLFAVDGSACSHHALVASLKILAGRPIEATVVGVSPPTERLLPPPPSEGSAASIRQATLDAVAWLDARGVKAHALDRVGDPGEAIVEAAERLGAELVVVGTHARGALARALLGSVSTHVLRHWPGPLLVVGPEGDA